MPCSISLSPGILPILKLSLLPKAYVGVVYTDADGNMDADIILRYCVLIHLNYKNVNEKNGRRVNPVTMRFIVNTNVSTYSSCEKKLLYNNETAHELLIYWFLQQLLICFRFSTFAMPFVFVYYGCRSRVPSPWNVSLNEENNTSWWDQRHYGICLDYLRKNSELKFILVPKCKV